MPRAVVAAAASVRSACARSASRKKALRLIPRTVAAAAHKSSTSAGILTAVDFVNFGCVHRRLLMYGTICYENAFNK